MLLWDKYWSTVSQEFSSGFVCVRVGGLTADDTDKKPAGLCLTLIKTYLDRLWPFPYKAHCKVIEATLLHLPYPVGFILASSDEQSDPKMPQLYFLSSKNPK